MSTRNCVCVLCPIFIYLLQVFSRKIVGGESVLKELHLRPCLNPDCPAGDLPGLWQEAKTALQEAARTLAEGQDCLARTETALQEAKPDYRRPSQHQGRTRNKSRTLQMDALCPIASGTFVTVGHFWW